MNKVQDQVPHDILDAIGEEDKESIDEEKIENKSSSINGDSNKPYKVHIPSERIMNHLLHEQFSYERKRILFLTVNTITLCLSLFNLISSVNIEGADSLILSEEAAILEVGAGYEFQLFYLIFILIVVHIIKIFSCIIGYFAVNQKSERLITHYMIFSSAALILRGVVTLLIIINYESIVRACEYLFGKEDDVAQTMATQYIILLIVFVIAEILLSLISLVQGSQSKEEYIKAKKYYEKVLKRYSICYEKALQTYF